MKITKPVMRRLRWALKPLSIVVALIATLSLMTYLGGLMFQSQQTVLNFGAALDDWFWILFAFRVLIYASLYWKSQQIFSAIIGSKHTETIDFTAPAYRHMLLRVIVVYELVFPFDVIGLLNGGGF